MYGFEPINALASDNNGLADIETIVKAAPRHLKPGSGLFLEHGWQQAESVRRLLRGAGFKQINTAQDLAGPDRVTGGIWLG